MSFKVLYVCSANVCRSPTAARVLETALPEELGFVGIETAGTRAGSHSPTCPRAQQWMQRHHIVLDGAERPSRRLRKSHVDRATIIVAADLEVRADVVRTFLDARERVFTMTEAAALARGVSEALVGGSSEPDLERVLELTDPPGRRSARLSWMVEEMNAARGLVPVPNGRRAEPLDAHDPKVRISHRRSLGAVQTLGRTLAQAMEKVALT